MHRFRANTAASFKQIGLMTILSFALSPMAGAATTLTSFSNYFKTASSDPTTGIVIYAGNTFKSCTGDNSTTCDSCANWGSLPISNFNTLIGNGSYTIQTGYNGLACNSQQIYPTLGFSITAQTADASFYTAGTACGSTPLIATGGTGSSTGTILPDLTPTETNPGTAGSNITATWSWANLCQKLSGDSSCKTSFTNTMTVGFSKDCTTIGENPGIRVQINFRYVGFSPPQSFGDFSGCSVASAYEGFCHFAVYPGDQKVYVDAGAHTGGGFVAGDLHDEGTAALASSTWQTYPLASDSSAMKYSYLRIYYEPGSAFSSITMASPHVDLPTDGGTTLSESRVKDLTNDQPYVFLSANVDQAGNVTLFTDPTYGKTGVIAPDPTAGTGANIGRTQGAIPEPVYGLLDGKKCFIATAAYGSIDAGEVQTLRRFRNQYLLTWGGGREFVKFYYKISPPIAEFISEREWLKALVRGSLEPIVLMASIAFEYGMIALLVIVLMAGLIFTGSISFLKRRTAK